MANGYWVELGQMAYGPAWELQRQVGTAVQQGRLPDTVLTVEHPPVFTVGRAAHGSREHLLWDAGQRARLGIELFEVDRGGDITYHGPGQLVAYPILDLNHYDRDLHRYLRNLEEALIRTLGEFDIAAGRLPPYTGVWVDREKVAAIGVKASHWVTQHGLALNVDPDLGHFAGIIPCGITEHGVTSMAKILGCPVALPLVAPVVVRHLGDVLQRSFQPLSLGDLMAEIGFQGAVSDTE